MKKFLIRLACGLGIIAVLSSVPVACISQERADQIKEKIDQSEAGAAAVLMAAGHPELSVFVHPAASLAKWITGLCVAGGGAATVAGGVTHGVHAKKHAKRKVIDSHYDSAAIELAKMLEQTQAVLADRFPEAANSIKAAAGLARALAAPVPPSAKASAA
jgi:hypothetical protein